MAITESEIVLPDGTKERTLQDSVTKRHVEVVALTNPVTGAAVVPGSESTLQQILAAIIAGGGGVTWPLAIDLLTEDPAPQADKVLFYALTDGGVTPNNTISLKYLLPDGTQIIQQVMTI